MRKLETNTITLNAYNNVGVISDTKNIAFIGGLTPPSVAPTTMVC